MSGVAYPMASAGANLYAISHPHHPVKAPHEVAPSQHED
jgi:hypothetical protein